MLASQCVGIRSISRRGFASLALAGLFALVSGGALAQAKTPYVIGAVLSLSGPVAANGVPTLIYYPLPLHRQRCYDGQGWKAGDYPVAEATSGRILPLPMYPELTDAQVDHVIAEIRRFHGA